MAEEETPEEEEGAKGSEEEIAPKKKKSILPLILIIAVAAAVIGVVGGVVVAKVISGDKAPTEHGEKPNEDVEQLKADAEDPHGGSSDGHGEEESGGHGKKKDKGGHGGHGGGHGEEPAEEKLPIYRLAQPIVTNLGNSRRIVVAKVWFETKNPDDVSFVEKNEHHLTNALVFLFSNKTVEDVTSMEGKEQLRREIMQRVNETVVKGKIKAVGFDQLHVQ
ncbi:MAG: flagellar basal body-associated protein FliL [Candidatus Sumerlaeia bacterium]